MNISELVFRKYCKANGIKYKKIPKCNEKTADYMVQFNRKTAIVEIKETSQKKEMISNLKDLESERNISFDWGTPGKRVRSHIDSAKLQLRRYKNKGIPTVLLQYQNTSPLFYLYDYDYLVGMYGLETHEIQVPDNPKKTLVWGKRKFGPKQKMTCSRKRYISVVMSVAPEDQNPIEVFYNYFADYPMEKSDFDGLDVEHFVIVREDNLFKEWTKI